MTICSLDTLIHAIRDALLAANENLRMRRIAVLEGAAELSLQVQVPQSPAPNAPCSPVALPLHLFRDRRTPHIGLLSIEFDCSLRFHRAKGGRASPQLLLRIGKPRFAWLLRQKIHHVRIAYLSANAWQPFIEIDGRQLVAPLSLQTEV